MLRSAVVVLLLAPAVSLGLEWSEFELFYRGPSGSGILLLNESWEYKEKQDVHENMIEVKVDSALSGYYVSKKHPEPEKTAFKTAVCHLSIVNTLWMRCERTGGVLSGAYFTGTPHEVDNNDLTGLPADVQKLYADYIRIREYGALGIVFRCASGCTRKTPQLILLVWRGD
jgi:hypothetical protein